MHHSWVVSSALQNFIRARNSSKPRTHGGDWTLCGSASPIYGEGGSVEGGVYGKSLCSHFVYVSYIAFGIGFLLSNKQTDKIAKLCVPSQLRHPKNHHDIVSYRLPRLKTDILVSINTPLPSGVRDAEELSPLTDALTRVSRVRELETELAKRYGNKEMAIMQLLFRVTKSLRIHNTGLFVV